MIHVKRLLIARKIIDLVSLLEVLYKKNDDALKYPKGYHYHVRSWFKLLETNLLENHDVKFNKIWANWMHNYTAFKKDFANFKPMHDPEKTSSI